MTNYDKLAVHACWVDGWMKKWPVSWMPFIVQISSFKPVEWVSDLNDKMKLFTTVELCFC